MRIALLFTGMIILASGLLSQAAAVEGRDRVVLRGNAFPAIVERETREGIEYRVSPAQPNVQTRRWSEVVEIIYHGMDSGFYRAGMQAMNSGRYEEAASRFASLASEATREWQGAYGFYRQGEAWERAGDYEQAAAAFASFVTTYEDHRLWLDALYRQGINLARGGVEAEAQAVADQLMDYGRENLAAGRGPEFRANAIRAAMMARSGDLREATRLANRVALAPRDGDTWFHWGSFWAGYLYELGEFRDAAQAYNRMLSQVGDEPAQRAELSLGYGISLARAGDEDAALMELLRLDTLPYGSPAQRCQAQYWAGKILTEQGERDKEHEDSRVADFARAKHRRGILLLQAAAASISDHPKKIEARSLLTRLLEDEAPAEEQEEAVLMGE